MFVNDNQAQVRDKLTILYVLHGFDRTITQGQLEEFVLDNDLMNYFALQQYMGEMTTAELVEAVPMEVGQGITITSKGKSSLDVFKDRLKSSTVSQVDQALEQVQSRINMERQIQATYKKINEGHYKVHLQMLEGSDPLIDLNLTVFSNSRAKQLCDHWKKDATSLYAQIMGTLIES